MASEADAAPTPPPSPPEAYLESFETSGSPSGNQLYEHQYVVGLSLLLLLICIGVSAAVFMCLTIRRYPILWSRTFGGFVHKTNQSRGDHHVPRRVRFNVPASRADMESTASAVTVVVAAADEGEDPCD